MPSASTPVRFIDATPRRASGRPSRLLQSLLGSGRPNEFNLGGNRSRRQRSKTLLRSKRRSVMSRWRTRPHHLSNPDVVTTIKAPAKQPADVDVDVASCGNCLQVLLTKIQQRANCKIYLVSHEAIVDGIFKTSERY